MKETELTQAIQEAVDLKLKAIDHLVKELVTPLEKVGNPEELLGKSYEQWTPQDLSMLIQIYGQGDNTPLSNLIFRKTYSMVKELEQEEVENA